LKGKRYKAKAYIDHRLIQYVRFEWKVAYIYTIKLEKSSYQEKYCAYYSNK